MPDDILLEVLKRMMMVGLVLCAPVLGVALVLGLIVGLVQAITSIQEQTLSFVPKLVGIALMLAVLGSWMLRYLVEYTAQ
jgi:flagellar biosynthetic protein FliQ